MVSKRADGQIRRHWFGHVDSDPLSTAIVEGFDLSSSNGQGITHPSNLGSSSVLSRVLGIRVAPKSVTGLGGKRFCVSISGWVPPLP